MQVSKKQSDPTLKAILHLLSIVSLMGFLYCLLVLLHGAFVIETTDVTLYLIWFGISYLSANIMKHGDILGAFALGIATIAITVYDLIHGQATLGGAMLGLVVLTIIIMYVRIDIKQNSRQHGFNH